MPSPKRQLPEQTYLAECFRYEADTGNVYWRERPASHFQTERTQRGCNTRFAGTQAFKAGSDGRSRCVVDRVQYLGHRLIWKLVHGTEPDEIDHIDGNKGNNRLGNLRAVDRTGNMQNTALRSNNKSGRVGVHFDTRRRAWVASIQVDGRSVYLGRFASLEDAAHARSIAEARYGFHQNHGRSRMGGAA